jgi:hypothetical protein
MTTPSGRNLNIATSFLLLAGLAGTANAQMVPPPTCPSKDCSKVITFYNNTGGPIFAVIQAGIQNPDPWLQALFNDNTQTYAETHYSRAYINPVNGIPSKGHVSVTVPWYSKLTNDVDQYADWYNGCRIYFFDSAEALQAAHKADQNSPLSVTAGSPVVSCPDCTEPVAIFKDTLAIPPNIPFQLVEYTFADIDTVGKPFIRDLNVGYNISYLDQIYLPLALEPCRTEPCDSPDPSAFGYLGTTQALDDFRSTLTKFSNTEGWPRYNAPLDDAKRPRLPGTYNVLVDRVNVIEKQQPSEFTPPGLSVKNLMDQWALCTSNNANANNCPEFQTYREIDNFFKTNYNAYRVANTTTECTQGAPYYPDPATLTTLNIMPYVYGWVPFNSGCGPAFNSLKGDPSFDQALFDYIHILQYNYRTVKLKQQRFNPFVNLVHGQLGANGYAYSVDDAISFENHPGEGLIIAIGGANGLPNPQPVVPPPDYTTDFQVNLGDSKAQNRPLWKSYGVCKDVADTDFPPLPPNATVDAPKIIVDTATYKISPTNPCTITVTDASNSKYQFTIKMAVPWPTYTKLTGFDPNVLTCVNKTDDWCTNINETAIQGANPQFNLFTQPPKAQPGGRR